MALLIKSINDNLSRDIRMIYEYFSQPSKYDHYNEIIPGLFLGNYIAARSEEFINDNKINLVINCSKDLEFPSFYNKINNHHINYLRIPIDDSRHDMDQLIMELNLEKVCPLIHKYISQRKNVYVHCYAGMQRSATVILCYLIYKDLHENNKINKLKSYYNFLKSKRVVVFRPDPTFVDVIYKYHKKLRI